MCVWGGGEGGAVVILPILRFCIECPECPASIVKQSIIELLRLYALMQIRRRSCWCAYPTGPQL